jgi:hypothetical protein
MFNSALEGGFSIPHEKYGVPLLKLNSEVKRASKFIFKKSNQ